MRRLLAVVLAAAFSGHPAAQTPKPSFEEATVAGVAQPIRDHERRQLSPTTLFDQDSLLQLIVSAYLDADGVGACALKIMSGGECAPIVPSVPAWMRTSRFEVAAKLPTASLPVDVVDRLRDFRFTGSPRQNVYPLPVQLMLQRLLEETFDLTVHRERREIPVWAITRTKEVSLMHSSLTATVGMNGFVMGTRRPHPPRSPDDTWVLVFEGSTLKDAADFFSGFLDRPVIDRTGVDGHYNFAFEFKPVPGASWRKGPWGPMMAGFDTARLAAGLDTLGFALEATTAPFDVLVIEDRQAGNASAPAFEVATLRINRSGQPRPRHSVIPASGQVTITNVTVRELIQDAYGVTSPSLLINLPEWARTERVDVIAKAASPAPVAALQRMLQPLLAEHFKLAVHWEVREMDVFALAVANPGRLGPRLQKNDACDDAVGTAGGFARAPDGAPNEKGTCGILPGGAGRIVARGLDMPGLAAFLGTSPGRMVIDRTGLTGRYDVDLTYTPSAFSAEALAQRAGATRPPGVDPAGPPLLTAVQEQLGLKLEPARGSVNVLVIDRVEPLTN